MNIYRNLSFETFALILIACVAFRANAFEVSVTDKYQKIFEEKAASSTGLDKVYVANGITPSFQIRISDAGSSQVSGFKYSSLGGGYASEIKLAGMDDGYIVEDVEGNCGYIFESENERKCIWVVDYSEYKLIVESVSASAESDCSRTVVDISGSGSPIKYYALDGRPCILSREIKVEYSNLEWSESETMFKEKEITSVLESLPSKYTISPPLYTASIVKLSGDRFLDFWAQPVAMESEKINASGIAVHASCRRINSGDEPEGDSELSGSAPIEIKFTSEVTDNVAHYEWQISTTPDFEELKYRFNEKDLEFTFDEAGKHYVRFIGSNADGSCESIGEVFEIAIDPSDLKIPNAFSPNGDGVNDVWRVSAKSLVQFKCTIFDRNGRELYFFDTPDGGWDGSYKGKKVASGVYYYVLEAKGADGKVYKKGGDINIVGYRKVSNIQN